MWTIVYFLILFTHTCTYNGPRQLSNAAKSVFLNFFLLPPSPQLVPDRECLLWVINEFLSSTMVGVHSSSVSLFFFSRLRGWSDFNIIMLFVCRHAGRVLINRKMIGVLKPMRFSVLTKSYKVSGLKHSFSKEHLALTLRPFMCNAGKPPQPLLLAALATVVPTFS